MPLLLLSVLFFFNDTATTEIYTLSLHDALPISLVDLLRDPPAAALGHHGVDALLMGGDHCLRAVEQPVEHDVVLRSEEHTSELQSRQYLVCRLRLEKKKKKKKIATIV